MAYRLKAGEPLTDGVKRVIHSKLSEVVVGINPLAILGV